MSQSLIIGTHVQVPAHRMAGVVVTLAGEAPDRRVGVETTDGSIITVRESDVVVDGTAPPPAPPPPAPGHALDLVVFARDLVRRTQHLRGDEAQAVCQLARAYLIAMGRRP